MMKVADLMRVNLNKALADIKLEALLCKHSELSASRLTYVVDENDNLLGIISANTLLKLMIPSNLTPDDKIDLRRKDDRNIFRKSIEANKEKTAREIMSTDYSYLRPDDHFLKANLLLVDKPVNALPVLEGTRIVGEVTRRVILTYLVNISCYCEIPVSGEKPADFSL